MRDVGCGRREDDTSSALCLQLTAFPSTRKPQSLIRYTPPGIILPAVCSLQSPASSLLPPASRIPPPASRLQSPASSLQPPLTLLRPATRLCFVRLPTLDLFTRD